MNKKRKVLEVVLVVVAVLVVATLMLYLAISGGAICFSNGYCP